jgi:hypothetical protein
MQRVRITRPRRTRDHRREAECFQILPLDPRDPAIVRAKELVLPATGTPPCGKAPPTRYGYREAQSTVALTPEETAVFSMVDHIESFGAKGDGKPAGQGRRSWRRGRGPRADGP